MFWIHHTLIFRRLLWRRFECIFNLYSSLRQLIVGQVCGGFIPGNSGPSDVLLPNLQMEPTCRRTLEGLPDSWTSPGIGARGANTTVCENACPTLVLIRRLQRVLKAWLKWNRPDIWIGSGCMQEPTFPDEKSSTSTVVMSPSTRLVEHFPSDAHAV